MSDDNLDPEIWQDHSAEIIRRVMNAFITIHALVVAAILGLLMWRS